MSGRRYAPVPPMQAAMRAACPRCGRGKLFAGFLAVRDECAVCGFDLTRADSGDGPAFFVMFAVGFVAVAFAFWLRFALDLPAGAVLLLAVVLTLALTLALLRPTKALLVALQYRNDASEGRLR